MNALRMAASLGLVAAMACAGCTPRARPLAATQPAASAPAVTPTLVVDAVLTATSPAPEPGVYTRALVLYTYEVTAVVSGTYAPRAIQVYHWAILDRQLQPATTQRRRGQAYRLELAPFEDYPALETVDRTENQIDLDLPLFMDLGLGHLPARR